MVNKRFFAAAVISLVLTVNTFAATLEENWNDFIHFTAIGNLELAQGYAQTIIDSTPDPVELLVLSEENPAGYGILLKVYNSSPELKDVAGKLLDIIEEGRFVKRTDPEVIKQEIARLSTTIKGRIDAERRLKNAGEYAVPFFLDVLADPAKKNELPYVSDALGKMSRDAIMPLVASLQMDDVALKVEVIRALGKIGYQQSLAYLKYIYETSNSVDLKSHAKKSIEQIDPDALRIPSAKLFFKLGNDYFYKTDSLAPSADYDFANIWFWDVQDRRLKREKVSRDYYFDLMTMRSCEWALKADENTGEAIALWISAFFKAEQTGNEMPAYFGELHANAMTYAITAGPEYLHESLSRALRDNDDYLALNLVEALATNAGEASLLYRFGTEQPLVKAMSYKSLPVRYSSAIAIGSAFPDEGFVGSKLIIKNLSDALAGVGESELGSELSKQYAQRSLNVLKDLAVSRNKVVDICMAKDSLVMVLNSDDDAMRIQASEVLAYLDSPDAQQAIADIALDDNVAKNVRLAIFDSLIKSVKLSGQKLTEAQIDSLYNLAASNDTDADIRSASAGAYGSINLPSKKVKKLILEQSKS